MNELAILGTAALSMTSLQIAELVESRHDKVKQSIERLAARDVIQLPSVGEVQDNQSLSPNNKKKVYVFSGDQGKRDSIVVVAQLSPEFTARLVDRWQELEAQRKELLPDFSNPADAARAWAAQYEARLLAEKTKAEIGSRREATAMNTASHAIKKVARLEVQLDRSAQYATIKRMQMIYHGVKFDWRILKNASIEMDIPAIDVFDQNYGTVKAYHKDVWQEAYAIQIKGA